jgi:hemerythrin
MTIEWKDSYLLGEAEIDAQHRFVFALANEFIAAGDKAALTHCAMQLYQHTREHFKHEEALMRELQFPEYAAHVEWHNQFISRLNDISACIGQDSLQRQDLVNLMSDWALKHIVQYDARLASYIASQPGV